MAACVAGLMVVVVVTCRAVALVVVPTIWSSSAIVPSLKIKKKSYAMPIFMIRINYITSMSGLLCFVHQHYATVTAFLWCMHFSEKLSHLEAWPNTWFVI